MNTNDTLESPSKSNLLGEKGQAWLYWISLARTKKAEWSTLTPAMNPCLQAILAGQER
jgi:hypothetical protein